MRYLLTLLFLLLAAPALAAPFLVCDSYTTGAIPTHFLVVLDGASEVSTPAWSGTLADGSARVNALHFDVGNLPNGNHSGTVRACVMEMTHPDEACSDPIPFAFVKPAPPSIPTGLGLSR